MKQLIKVQVFDKSLHEIKQQISRDYAGEFEMIGKISVGDHVRRTHIRLRNVNDYESCINSIDERYDAEDAVINGYIFKIKTPQFNLDNRSHYGNGCDFKHETVEYRGNNCCIPRKGYCFVKCLKFITGEDYRKKI